MRFAYDLCELDLQDKPGLDPDTESQQMMFEEQLRIARELGLMRQASEASAKLRQLGRRRIASPPLTDAELAVWREWLPSGYRGDEELKDYAYDMIPVPILQQMQEWKKADVFDDFEIRTPETQKPDPALFGIRDGKCWLLARWAESDEQIVGYDEIRERVRQRIAAQRRRSAAVLILAAAALPWTAWAVRQGIAANRFWLFLAGFLGLFGALASMAVAGAHRSDKTFVWRVLQ